MHHSPLYLHTLPTPSSSPTPPRPGMPPSTGISTYGLPSPSPGTPAAASRILYSSSSTPAPPPSAGTTYGLPSPSPGTPATALRILHSSTRRAAPRRALPDSHSHHLQNAGITTYGFPLALLLPLALPLPCPFLFQDRRKLPFQRPLQTSLLPTLFVHELGQRVPLV